MYHFSIEQVKTYMEDSMLRTTFEPKRVSVRGKRFYYHKQDPDSFGGISRLFPSVTTVTKYMPHNEFEQLTKWIGDQGNEKADEYMTSRADFGTIEHILYAEYMRRIRAVGVVDAGLFQEEVWKVMVEYCKAVQRPQRWARENFMEMRKDLIGLRMFCQIYEYEPMLIEKTVFSEKHGYAGTLDQLGKITVGPRFGPTAKKAYQLKSIADSERVVALGDLKSGKQSTMYESQKLQLVLLKMAAEENWPELEIKKLFRISAKDWQTNPGFNMMEVGDDCKWYEGYEPVLKLAHMDLSGASDWNYKTAIHEPLMGEEFEPIEEKFNVMESVKVSKKTVMEAIRDYEVGSPDIEFDNAADLEAEWEAVESLKQSFTENF